MQRVIAKLDVLLKGRQQRASVCLSTNLDSPIYIEDSKSQGKSVFVIPPDELYSDQNCFKIINSAQQEILLWAVDGCFVGKGKPLSTAYPKKCDCVFGYENYLGFLELKLDSSEIPSPKAIEGNRQKAVEQLKDMICFLSKALSISGHFKIQGYVIEAFICTPLHYPSKNTGISDLALDFLETYGVPLFEENHKKCA